MVPLGTLPTSSQFSPTSVFCHVCFACHNIHVLHFTSIWCVICRAKQTKKWNLTILSPPPLSTHRPSAIANLTSTQNWWAFSPRTNKIKRELCFQLLIPVPQVSCWQHNDYIERLWKWQVNSNSKAFSSPFSSSSCPSPFLPTSGELFHSSTRPCTLSTVIHPFINSVHPQSVCFL